jgi:hypothetical protein
MAIVRTLQERIAAKAQATLASVFIQASQTSHSAAQRPSRAGRGSPALAVGDRHRGIMNI